MPLPTLIVADLERLAIEEALRVCGGKKPRASKLLGMAKSTLYRKLEEFRAEDALAINHPDWILRRRNSQNGSAKKSLRQVQ